MKYVAIIDSDELSEDAIHELTTKLNFMGEQGGIYRLDITSIKQAPDPVGEYVVGYDPKADITKERMKYCPLVEIVTCKDCIHRDKHGCRHGHPNCADNFWCRDGERREEIETEVEEGYGDGFPKDNEFWNSRITGNPDFCNG